MMIYAPSVCVGWVNSEVSCVRRMAAACTAPGCGERVDRPIHHWLLHLSAQLGNQWRVYKALFLFFTKCHCEWRGELLFLSKECLRSCRFVPPVPRSLACFRFDGIQDPPPRGIYAPPTHLHVFVPYFPSSAISWLFSPLHCAFSSLPLQKRETPGVAGSNGPDVVLITTTMPFIHFLKKDTGNNGDWIAQNINAIALKVCQCWDHAFPQQSGHERRGDSLQPCLPRSRCILSTLCSLPRTDSSWFVSVPFVRSQYHRPGQMQKVVWRIRFIIGKVLGGETVSFLKSLCHATGNPIGVWV